MLYFAKKPDPAFTAILHAPLEDMHGMLVDPGTDPADAERYWQAQCPLASKCFPLAPAVYTIDRLLVASRDPITVYRMLTRTCRGFPEPAGRRWRPDPG